MADPIRELVTALDDDGRPPLAWLVRWSAAGEPVAAAWRESTAPTAMLELLCRAQHADALHAILCAVDACHLPRTRAAIEVRWIRAQFGEYASRGQLVPGVGSVLSHAPSATSPPWYLAAAVRRAVPIPPTLAECLARAAEFRRRSA